jgi:hypothetical protein
MSGWNPLGEVLQGATAALAKQMARSPEEAKAEQIVIVGLGSKVIEQLNIQMDVTLRLQRRARKDALDNGMVKGSNEWKAMVASQQAVITSIQAQLASINA